MPIQPMESCVAQALGIDRAEIMPNAAVQLEAVAKK
jgi:hypothetical protein